MKTSKNHLTFIDRAVRAVAKTKPPTMHKVFDKTYVVVTPELGSLLSLIYSDCVGFRFREGIKADG